MAKPRKAPASPPVSTAPAVEPSAPAQAERGTIEGALAAGGIAPVPAPNAVVVLPGPDRVLAPDLGRLTGVRPALPDELADDLSPQDHALVWLMVSGKRWSQALDALNVPPRAALRDAGPPERIRNAAEWAVKELATRCGLDRTWILSQWVALYQRAAQAVPVLDREGNETGEYRFDGGTAVKALTALENHAGVAPAKRPGQLDVSDVATLLRAVAQAGKPTLEERQGRLVGTGSAVDK